MTEPSDLADRLKTQAHGMAPITMRAAPAEENSRLYRDMSVWMHEAAALMNAASAALTAAAQVREKAPEPPPYGCDVQCKCGWTGKQSELLQGEPLTGYCPRCLLNFSAFPSAVPLMPIYGAKEDTSEKE